MRILAHSWAFEGSRRKAYPGIAIYLRFVSCSTYYFGVSLSLCKLPLADTGHLSGPSSHVADQDRRH